MFNNQENNLNNTIEDLNIDSVYSYIQNVYFKEVETKFIANILDFLTVNKNKVHCIDYGYANLSGFKEIENNKNYFNLRFESAALVVPKPCVVALVDIKDSYCTYYAINKDGKILEIIIWI